MSGKTWGAILAIGLAGLAPGAAAQATWVNDHAVLVVQSVEADGRLTGTYRNNASQFACAGITYPVTGWIDGDAISFSTLRKDRRNCTAIESWTGLIRGNELLVEFLAIARNGSESSLLRGSDRYRRQ